MLTELLKIAQQAGDVILSVYNQPAHTSTEKADGSLLTEADLLSHQLISEALLRHYPAIPILSEESSQQADYTLRQHWTTFFLVDPLDGTREFLQRNGEFTINIALIHENTPVLGIIHAPVLGMTYYAEKGHGAHKITGKHTTPLSVKPTDSRSLRVATSRSHLNAETRHFLEQLTHQGHLLQTTPIGSALKFGLLAEGLADLYPRLSPTMEWDTAAGQAILNETGGVLLALEDRHPLQYNKRTLVNPSFIALANARSNF